ncbi:RNA polymerase sigma factor [Aquimarina sp. 2201CG14-23]|uniref:RNA polymerase sigma factor n=1 Tax=Aquimarina mycalae TaxID=3040073 RepID=UPI002477D4C3|nr:sigma-70 family RNA polymerase sigma factor [Aquimarina sp. 2201CG14-23]MDH7447749.1 sigma-70 family RNA polymerase sigma factor [Aquimarina sp. 2201CG14-23]
MNKDQLIIAGIINGDEHVLKGFYRDNIRYIQGYILRNYGSTQDVEDVFQDALVVLYQKLKSGILEITVPVKTYFYGICKNIWKNRLRKKKKLITDQDQVSRQENVNDSLVLDIENQEREHLYRKHFRKLSTNNKNLLLLYFEGKSAKEISQITGYSIGYTRKKKFEAKRQLLAMIEKDPMYEELKMTS